jgi:hypothetical protein
VSNVLARRLVPSRAPSSTRTLGAVDRNREAEELVRLWQELQEAQVTGDVERLTWLHRRAEAESRDEEASEEWRLLADDAARQADRLRAELAAQPSAGVAGDAVVVVDTAPTSESAPEPAGGRRGRTGSLIWLAILVGWILLQVFQAATGGDGSP